MGNWKRILVAAAGLVLLAIQGTTVLAQAPAGQGLEISPPLIEISTDPGKTVEATIKLRNITKEVLVTSSAINDFVAEGEDGQAKLELDENAEPSPYSFKTWVQDIPSISLNPGAVQSIKVVFNVPQDASPGGHYGVVRFSGQAPGVDSSGVSLSASLGTLVLIKVSGQIDEKVSLASFYASSDGKKSSSFFQSGPIKFVERLKNDGNVHFKPTGTIRITNTLGKETAVISVNQFGGNVLPASVRRFEQTLDKKRMFGHYSAELNIQYNGKTITDKIGFWVLPLKPIALGLGVIILLVLGLRFYVKQAVKKAANGSKKNSKD